MSQHFQKDIVRGVEGFISISRKQKHIGVQFFFLFCFFLFYQGLLYLNYWKMNRLSQHL